MIALTRHNGTLEYINPDYITKISRDEKRERTFVGVLGREYDSEVVETPERIIYLIYGEE